MSDMEKEEFKVTEKSLLKHLRRGKHLEKQRDRMKTYWLDEIHKYQDNVENAGLGFISPRVLQKDLNLAIVGLLKQAENSKDYKFMKTRASDGSLLIFKNGELHHRYYKCVNTTQVDLFSSWFRNQPAYQLLQEKLPAKFWTFMTKLEKFMEKNNGMFNEEISGRKHVSYNMRNKIIASETIDCEKYELYHSRWQNYDRIRGEFQINLTGQLQLDAMRVHFGYRDKDSRNLELGLFETLRKSLKQKRGYTRKGSNFLSLDTKST